MIKIRKMAGVAGSAYVCFFVLLLGFMLIGELCYAEVPTEASAKSAFGKFADVLLAILGGPIGKVMALIALVGAGGAALGGKYGLAAGCFIACLIFAFAPTIVGLLFGAK